jgi:FkbM family methyltransferase
MKKLVKRGLRRLGFDVMRFRPETSLAARLAATLSHLETDLILDVGANSGQFALSVRELGYRGRIVSFEPMREAHGQLIEQQRRARDPQWLIADRCALGDRDGDARINISANSVSSSLLPMLAAHVAGAPDSAYIGSETVPLRRLDGVATPFLRGAQSAYLKIDTQGYEAQVLAGATGLLPGIAALQIELSLVSLYAGQLLMAEMIALVEAAGFRLFSLYPGFTDERSGQTYQVDGIFVRA